MTDVALRDYLERLIHEADRRYEQRFAASEQAVLKAERTMSSRLDSMNEFRDALKDQAARMATRVEVDRIDESVQALQRDKANLDGRLVVLSAGTSIVVSAIVGLAIKWLVF